METNIGVRNLSIPSNNESSVKDYEWAVNYHRKVFKLCGLWSYSKPLEWYIKLLTEVHSLIIIACIITSLTIPEVMALTKVWADLTLIVDNFLSSIPLCSAQIKLIVLWTKRKAIAKIFDAVKSDWLEPKNEFERQIMIKYARIANIMMIIGISNIAYNLIIFHGCVIFGFSFRTTTNLTDIEGYLIATQTVFPFDVTIGYRYWVIRIVHALECYLAGTVYTGIDVFFGMSVLHNCGQLEILAEKIKCMVNSDEPLMFKELLKTIVLRHYRIISLIEEIKDIFSSVLLLLVMCFGITFSVMGFLIATSFGSTGTRVPFIQMNFYMGYIFFFVGLMFVYSWVGENLVTHSEGIYLAVYNCDWTALDSKQTTQLIILLVRSQKPLEVTIGKFAPVSLNTFAQLLKTSMGYISVLLAKQD
ncbi:odorant receptor Or2-like [Microplitis mediator]|uniref:odorant receptor Or2-like n=1 Tax=Microplitis mediator TaxID=375433 RepID=UPI00255418D7|nr:odorant receptor Or2-like [Microplitis mediator]